MSDTVETGELPHSAKLAERFNDLVIKTELADYGPVRGTMVFLPDGKALWNQIQRVLGGMIDETGVLDVNFPSLIPWSFLEREKEHVDGFAPECAIVTHGGGEQLKDPLVVRPTSETIINGYLAKRVRSYRELPVLWNQWVNVVRWEMRTRLFLRTLEFLWQEGHTSHATADDAETRARMMLEVYRKFAHDWLALPVLTGVKTERERFAGAVRTYCIEAMMLDGKALQAGTSHFLGQNFSKTKNPEHGIRFHTKEGTEEHVWQTSWGVSTRLIGALILGHMDEKGLVLPPRLAPTQVVIVPFYKGDDEQSAVLAKCHQIAASLKAVARVAVDDRDYHRAGYKLMYWEQKGVPLMISVGPRDVAKGTVEISRRDTGKAGKLCDVSESSLATLIPTLLDRLHQSMFDRALKFRQDNTVAVATYAEMQEALAQKNVFVEAFWAGSSDDEAKIKEETRATVRCIPFAQDEVEGKCLYTGKATKTKVVFARSH